jgi:4-hydroxybenzoyl-CoA reductase subunit beta
VRLPKFMYFEPTSLKEALSILKKDGSAKILAGGTDLLVNMKHRIEVPSALVNIKKIDGLDYIRNDQGAVRLGVLTSLKKISQDSFLREKLPALTQAASAVGSYHHQCMGTIGGNICQQNRCKFFNQSEWWRSTKGPCLKVGGDICHVVAKKGTCYSSYCGDLAPALLALEARIILQSKKGLKEAALESLFSGKGQAPLKIQPGEILTEIVIPETSLRGHSSYNKFANRESIDFPIVGLALWVSPEKKEYRAAFTAVDRRPLRAMAVEKFLNHKDLTEEIIGEAAVLASKEAQPVKTSLYSSAFKKKMMGILLKQALKETGRRVQS